MDTNQEIQVEAKHASGVRCPRGWRWVPELIRVEPWGEVSPRCADVLANLVEFLFCRNLFLMTAKESTFSHQVKTAKAKSGASKAPAKKVPAKGKSAASAKKKAVAKKATPPQSRQLLKKLL